MKTEKDLLRHQTEGVEILDRLLREEGGALLADAAGTGKSWIAAALARRWERAGCRVHAIVPSPLQPQWQRVLSAWGSSAEIFTHDSIRPGDRPDLVIVDEAHRFRNRETKRYARLAIHCRNSAVLLVTATPAVNGPHDAVNLLRLLIDDDGLAEAGIPSIDDAVERDELEMIGAASSRFIVRRSEPRSMSLTMPPLSQRRITFIPPPEWQLVQGLIEDLEFPGTVREASGVMRALFRRRYLSSPAAFEGTIDRQLRYLRRLTNAEARGQTLMRSMHRQMIDDATGDQSILFPDAFFEPRPLASEPAAARESERLLKLQALVRRSEIDPKLEVLCALLDSGESAIVFSESAETARYLWSKLSSRLPCGLITAAGGRDANGERAAIDDIFALFRSRTVRVLVTTDLAAEGVDLQVASLVVHYDLPWSEVRLEQRVARAARLGSGAGSVTSVLLLPEDERHSSMIAIERKASECARFFSRQAPRIARAPFCIPRVGRRTPQFTLMRRLVACDALTVDLAAALSRRHRTGLEVQLQEIERRGALPSAVLVKALRRTLASQRAMRRVVPDTERSTIQAATAASEASGVLW